MKTQVATVRRRAAFTLLELLVVIAIIAIIAAMILPALSDAKQRARTAQCISNLHQIGISMKMYGDDFNSLYPESGKVIAWNQIDSDTHKFSWMQQLISYMQNTNAYHCPSDTNSSFSYFNGARAAYVAVGDRASVDSREILYPSFYVLGGDTVDFSPNDADKDDYSYNCVGGEVEPGEPWTKWQTHNLGQNILFEDDHAKWYKGYVTNEMTFRYDTIHGWE